MTDRTPGAIRGQDATRLTTDPVTDRTPTTGTICQCGLAKSYHTARWNQDHKYAPRYPDRTPTALDAAWEALHVDLTNAWQNEGPTYYENILARHRPLIETAHAPLDVERVARIFHGRLDQSVLGHAEPVCQPCRQSAQAFVRKYAALEEPTDE